MDGGLSEWQGCLGHNDLEVLLVEVVRICKMMMEISESREYEMRRSVLLNVALCVCIFESKISVLSIKS